MIAHIWRGRTRADDSHGFTRLLQARTQAEPAASKACQDAKVILDPRRARLYAELRRRFPLRIAAPR